MVKIHQSKKRRERKVAMKEEEKQRRREAWKIHQNREREEREVIAFLKASWEEIFPLSVEEKIKATEEPLTRQERVFVGVDHKTVEEEQEENCLTFVKRGKTSEVKVGKSYENYNLISITIIHNS